MQVVGAVLVRDGSVLAGRRVGPPALAGRYEFPGGKIESGESPAQALARELREELRIEVSVGDELPGPRGAWPLGPGADLRVFWCTITAGTPVGGHSHDDLRWTPASGLTELDWVPADRPIAEAVAASLLATPADRC